MSIIALVLLFVASFVAGIINTIAGGGTFLIFPALLLTGLDPRAANITSTIALFPMQVGIGCAGRDMVSDGKQISFKTLFITSLIGGGIGALLLLVTPSDFFADLVPWLILAATAIFGYGSFVKKPTEIGAFHRVGKRGALLAQFAISVYGGYFGGGIGFLMLAALTLAGMSIRKAGHTKNILAVAMNTMAVLFFVFSPDVGWPQVGIEAFGSFLGGMLVGVKILRFVNERILRIAIVTMGMLLTFAMFIY